MPRKTQIDAFGAVSLTLVALLLAGNQVLIKLVNDGLQPIFVAGLRSVGGAVCILGWMRLRGIAVHLPRAAWPAALVIGAFFTLEFLFLFLALDLTTVTRSSVIFYTMPVWLALGAHVLLPGERLTGRKSAGLALAFAGVVFAITMRGGSSGQASLLGDLFALAASICWAGIALMARASRLSSVRPEVQLLVQLLLSAPILLALSPAFGPLLRDPQMIHWLGLGIQIVAVVSAGFLLWLWLLSIYPASSVAAFSFLSPVFGVGLGWAILGEAVTWTIAVALVLVCAGLVLVSRPARRRVVAGG